MRQLRDIASDANSILIAGHTRPDGDCVGACFATYYYLKNIFPGKEITVFLENLPERYEFLKGDAKCILGEVKEKYDLFLALDISEEKRLGKGVEAFRLAERTCCIDHHVSNERFAEENIVLSDASAACEVLYGMMEKDNITMQVAEGLYTGIITDSGMMRYSNTSYRTMQIVGELMDMGIPFGEIADRCIYEKTYTQLQILGRTLLESMRLMDGKCIVASISRRTMDFYGAVTEDIEGIIDQMRSTKGVEVAILLHETGEQEYKVSLRSNRYIDVNAVASYFGGGGHIRAAGCVMRGSVHDVFNNLTEHIEMQMLMREQ